jgi:hypothetical protein
VGPVQSLWFLDTESPNYDDRMLRFLVTVLTLSEAVTGYGDTFLFVPLNNKKSTERQKNK